MGTNNIKNEFFWHTLSVYAESIYIADATGAVIDYSLTKGVNNEFKTDLDSPYIAQIQNSVLLIGRWNTNLVTIDKTTKKLKQHPPLFTGRTTALTALESKFYIGGANKAVSIETKSKDKVELTAGVVFNIEETFQENNLNVKMSGRAQQLAVTEKLIAFVDDANSKVLHLYNHDGKFYKKIEESSAITAIVANNDTIFYAVSEKIKNIADDEIQDIPFKNDSLQILKMVKIQESFYLLTSQGVIETSTGNIIVENEAQPMDIANFRNGILTLWQNGDLEFYEKGQPIKKYQIH